MAYERNWQFLPVVGPRVAASVSDSPAWYLWNLKAFLKGEIGGFTQGNWSVYGSSDGSTFGLDGVDRLGTVSYNIASVPYVAITGAHAWIVLYRLFTVNSTQYTVYLLLAAQGSGGLADNGKLIYQMSTMAPTGGDASNNPTFGEVFYSKPTVNSPTDYAANVLNDRRLFGAKTTNGDFWFAETILGELSRGIYFAVPTGVHVNDQYPFFTHCVDSIAVSNLIPFGGSTLYTRSQNTSGGAGQGRYYNGAVGYPFLAQPPPQNLLDASNSSLFDYPAYVLVGTETAVIPSGMHARGRLPDTGLSAGRIANAPSSIRSVNIGQTIRDPSTNDVAYVTLNAFLVPYNNPLS